MPSPPRPSQPAATESPRDTYELVAIDNLPLSKEEASAELSALARRFADIFVGQAAWAAGCSSFGLPWVLRRLGLCVPNLSSVFDREFQVTSRRDQPGRSFL
jgi:hypothetical protein